MAFLQEEAPILLMTMICLRMCSSPFIWMEVGPTHFKEMESNIVKIHGPIMWFSNFCSN